MELFKPELQLFLLLSKHQSLSAVARLTGQDVGNLSRKLARLESENKGALFIRHKEGLVLTAAGEKLRKALLQGQESYEESFQENKQRILRIGLSPAVGVGFLNQELIFALQKLSFHPVFTLKSSLELFELLKKRELDFILSPKATKFPGIVEKVIAEDEVILCSLSGKAAKTLLAHEHMFDLEKRLKKVDYDERWMVNDYFLLGHMMSQNSHFMGLLPQKVMELYPKLKRIDGFKNEGKIMAMTWQGSPGMELLKTLRK